LIAPIAHRSPFLLAEEGNNDEAVAVVSSFCGENALSHGDERKDEIVA
jgi:hypothetical protein